MKHLTINDLDFCQANITAQERTAGGNSVPRVPTVSVATDVKLATKVTFNAKINYKTGAEYSGSAGYAGGYAASASIDGRSLAFVNVSVR